MEVLPQADYDMHQSKFFIISASMDGKVWNDDEIAEGSPINRVREILGGRWERSAQYTSYAKAFFSGEKRVLVLGFHPNKTKEFVVNEMQRIREAREDRS